MKDNIESYSKDTEVKVVMRLKGAIPSLTDGRLPNLVKMMSLISPLMEDLIQANIAFEFWMDLLFVREVEVVVISASVTE